MTEYIPKCLRERGKEKPVRIQYAIGIADGKGGFGMIHGPVDGEQEMLDTVPEHNEAYLLRFNTDGTYVVMWKWSADRWISVKRKPPSRKTKQ